MKVRKRTAVLAAGAALCMAGLGAGVASAAIPDSGGAIDGCYKPTPHGGPAALSVIDTALPNGHCPAGQTEVSWPAQQAAQSAGPNGSDTLMVKASGAAGNANGGTAYAVCPQDHPYVTGGGYQSGDVSVTPFASGPGYVQSDGSGYPLSNPPQSGGSYGEPHGFTDSPDSESLYRQGVPPSFNGPNETAQAWVVQVNATSSYPGISVWAMCAE